MLATSTFRGEPVMEVARVFIKPLLYLVWVVGLDDILVRIGRLWIASLGFLYALSRSASGEGRQQEGRRDEADRSFHWPTLSGSRILPWCPGSTVI